MGSKFYANFQCDLIFTFTFAFTNRDHNITVLFTHGVLGNVAETFSLSVYKHLTSMGVDVLTWDPPGISRPLAVAYMC